MLGLAAIAVTPLSADPLPGQPQVIERDAVFFGRTYADWSAAWQQWATSLPASEHPLFDSADCSTGQSGPVWFLGGKFCSTEDPGCTGGMAVRSCDVPAGTALFFPVINISCIDEEAKFGFCGDAQPVITQMRKFLADVVDAALAQAQDLQVTLNGQSIGGDLRNFRVQSTVFAATVPKDNLYQAIGEKQIQAGTYLGVDDGVYVLLAPLPAGSHVLNFKGAFPEFGFDLDITYMLNVLN